MPPPTPEITRWFAEQIQPHEPKLRDWLRARFPQLHDLDDLVQDTYVRVFRAKHNGKLSSPTDHPKAYLFTVARHAALDRCRRRQIISFEPLPLAELEPADERPSAASASDRDAELATLTEAIRSLPDRCREILILRKHHGLSHQQIADKLGISPHTVNAQITTAMVKCRAYFKTRGFLDHA